MVKQETGTVVRVENGEAAVRIRARRGDACGGCKACGAGGSGDFLLRLEAGDLKEGDPVTVEVAVPGPWRAILLVFALPLAFFMAGILIGGEWSRFQQVTGLGPEWGGIALGAALLPAPVLIAILVERRVRRRRRPRVIKTHRSG